MSKDAAPPAAPPAPPAPPIWLLLVRVLCLLLSAAGVLGVLIATLAMDAGPSTGGEIAVYAAMSGIATPLVAAGSIDARPASLAWLLLPAASGVLFVYGVVTFFSR